MANWQFHVYIIPKKSLFNRYGQIPKRLKMDYQDWKEYVQNGKLDKESEYDHALAITWWPDLYVNFTSLLPLLKGFGDIQPITENVEGMKGFGDTEGNDICVCYDEADIIEEIICRLDLRQLDQDFINKVLSLAIQFDCLLMDRQGWLYEPTVGALLDRIKLSNPGRLV